MKNNLLLILAGIIFVSQFVQGADQCLVCHELLEDNASRMFQHDVHRQKGITCAGCHGGNAASDDMEKGMDAKAGFIGVPKGDDITKTCASCHADQGKMKQLGSALPTDQVNDLERSVHGKQGTTASQRIAQCTSCHGAHGIVSKTNPKSSVYPLNLTKTCAQCHSNASYMRSYNPSLPVDQLDKYRTSVHGIRNSKGDPKAAECASCHGSHNILPAKDVRSKVYPTNVPATCGTCHSDPEYMKQYDIPTDQLESFSGSVHGVALLQKKDVGAPACNNCHGNHGASPPGVESISKVCGTCHALNAELFSTSPHKKAFDELMLPECEMCHGNHEIIAATDKLLGTAPEAVCSRCHSESDKPKGFRVAGIMRGLIDSLETSEDQVTKLVEDAEQKGMEVGEAKFKLRDVRQARLEARTKVHSFSEPVFREVIHRGDSVAAMVGDEAQHAIDEYYFRRMGLGVSTLIISALALSLFLFIRRTEKKQATHKSTTNK